MSLTLSRVGYTYATASDASRAALAGVDFEVEVGEIVLVLGTTGSGKSTLLRIAAGLLSADEGSASIDGAVLSRDTARGKVGLVFQDAESQLFADTLLSDVAFGPLNLGLSRAEAEDAARDALRAVGLDPDLFENRSPFTLSGGEARRAAIAGVLAMRPRYLLADEPTAALDASGRAMVRALLVEARQQAGVVVVSHTAEEFLPYADRVLILRDGRTAWSGPVARIVERPILLIEAGLAPPDVLEVCRLATECGLALPRHSLDPDETARMLAEARRGSV